MITVIEQNTQERREETIELFELIRPLLDQGYGYHSALIKVNRVKHGNYHRQGWFKELREYGESRGYPYKDYSGKGHKRA